MSKYKIVITHLFPELLNLYGDKGNIAALRKRLEWRGIEAEVIMHTAELGRIDFSATDIIFLGGGSDREEEIVLGKLMEQKQELKDFVEGGGSVAAICGGFPMLGKSLYINNKQCQGLGILDIKTEAATSQKRLMGDVILKCDGLNSKVVGFENHQSRTAIGSHTPLGKLVKGNGCDGESVYEGVIYKNVLATYLHGPIFPKNPELCDRFLLNCLKNKYPGFKDFPHIDDGLEELANTYIVNRDR